MEDFKDSFAQQLELLIQSSLEESNSLDPIQRITAIAEILIESAGATIDAINAHSKIVSIPNNRVAVLQPIPTDVFIKANQQFDEQIAEMEAQKQKAH